ncbi:acyl-CoA dehydrogenase family protein [Actinocrinis sp.]|uniref:acyl-CoA dehydrogenase family protein n=1 Tax=Actinocrinis sp. TaxID=1920516 RepID=UPI002D71A576|nr:acyl-CoA dehydrogenase family protein [Actinocrinis sp.]HZP49641.1 acyl-CoA dehydrogenase family protein [Actinocrinis sp.]
MTELIDRPRLPQAPLTDEQADWVARVERVTPLLMQTRDIAERDRRMPDEVFEALRELGFTRMWISKAFGGGQVGITTGMAVLEELARVDASVAWQIGVQGAIGRLSDYLPVQSSYELFAGSSGFVVGGVKPSGRAEPVAGGYLLKGDWAMASGSAHADWLLCTALVTHGGVPVVTETGPDIAMLFVPASKAVIRDTWYTVGLRGTGSNHYSVDELFVPDELGVRKSQMGGTPPQRPERGYPVSYFDFGPMSTAPVALGIAAEALEAFKEMAAGKVPASGTVALADSGVVQDRLGRAEMMVHSSRVVLHDAARMLESGGGSGDESVSALIRLASATLAENAMAAVDTAYTLAGSTSLYATSRLERCFRDVHSVTKHLALSHSHYETVGQYLLGGHLQVRK